MADSAQVVELPNLTEEELTMLIEELTPQVQAYLRDKEQQEHEEMQEILSLRALLEHEFHTAQTLMETMDRDEEHPETLLSSLS